MGMRMFSQLICDDYINFVICAVRLRYKHEKTNTDHKEAP